MSFKLDSLPGNMIAVLAKITKGKIVPVSYMP